MTRLKSVYENLKRERDGEERFLKILGTVDATIDEMKAKDPDLYEKLKLGIYIDANGYHFDEEMLESAYAGMINDDGSRAPFFPLDEVEKISRRMSVRFNAFNLYDFAYTMNMLYSDYCQVIGSDSTTYSKMALKFLADPDAQDGGATKALRYYMSVRPEK